MRCTRSCRCATMRWRCTDFSRWRRRLCSSGSSAWAAWGRRWRLPRCPAFSPAGLVAAVQAQDVAAVQRIPGVGKKTASRIILELKGSFDEGLASLFDGAAPAAASAANLAGTREALLSMGFTSEEADVALKGAPEGASEGVLLQYALKRLGSAGLPTGGTA